VFSDFVGSFVVVGSDGFDELGQVRLVFGFDVFESNTGALFSADKLSESGFAFNDAVRDIHLSAKSWKVDNNFDWVDVVSDDNELSLFSFDQVDDLVDTAGEGCWSLAWGVWLSFSSGFGSGHQSGFFLGLIFWGVLGGEFKQLSGGLLVKSLRELVD